MFSSNCSFCKKIELANCNLAFRLGHLHNNLQNTKDVAGYIYIAQLTLCIALSSFMHCTLCIYAAGILEPNLLDDHIIAFPVSQKNR